MISATMTYLLAISAITAGAAWIAEAGLRRAGVSTRLVWMAAMLLGPTLLATSVLLPRSAPTLVGGAVGPVIELPALQVGRDTGSLFGAEEWLLAMWLATAAVMIAVVLRTRFGLDRERKRWKRVEMAGRSVYVSPHRGPAVAGVIRPWIVLPRWLDELPEGQRDLVLMHEEEHVRGGDTILLSVALVMLCSTPWNPLTWLHFRRLRAAMEVDCDRRVLRRRPEPAAYGDSLIAVAARSSGAASLALAAFTEPAGVLERRIVAMTHRRTRWTSFRAVLLTLGSVALASQACGVEGPVTLDERGIETVGVEPGQSVVPSEPDLAGPDAREGIVRDPDFDRTELDREVSAEAIRAAPTFTPFTVAPSITNREEVVRVMAESYPPLLREAGIGGTVRVYFLINEEGIVEQVRLDQSAGHPALDDAALNVAGAYRFSPALNRDEKVPVWVSFPITFQVR
jgi:TonB family protein